jgi:hypothetical protein
MPEKMRKSVGRPDSETGQRMEQRREPRSAVDGEVRFLLGEGDKEVRGKLLDRSASGFRAEHDCPELACGQLVQFHLKASSKGVARVVWTRISAGRVETGFLIIP